MKIDIHSKNKKSYQMLKSDENKYTSKFKSQNNCLSDKIFNIIQWFGLQDKTGVSQGQNINIWFNHGPKLMKHI